MVFIYFVLTITLDTIIKLSNLHVLNPKEKRSIQTRIKFI